MHNERNHLDDQDSGPGGGRQNDSFSEEPVRGWWETRFGA